MPPIVLNHLRSFSSEDKKYPAENLLKGDGFKKWKNANVGEKQASVVLQFEKASQIHSVDIGNEGSAFVEILVARSTENNEPDFQVLLVASSFMSPQESKNSTNLNRVRMFDKEKLTQSLVNEKWDLVKIVCTQPFNKNVQYGLSFIKFHATMEESDKAKEKTNILGMFKMKEKPKEEVKVGSTFATHRKEKESINTNASVSASASARTVSKFADEVLAKETASIKAKLDSTKAKPISNDRNRDSSPKNGTKPKDTRRSPELKRKRSPTPERKRRSPSPKRFKNSKKSPISKPFNKLMENVVFVLSGYQNPERANIRDKAVEMGATYKPDWGKTCTHLICAFPNTPKYNAVRNKGRIVEADWIKKCYKERKLLPWRSYRVGKARTPQNSSDEECIAEEIAEKKRNSSEEIRENSANKPSTSNEHSANPIMSDSDSIYDQDTDVEEMNTDDEIENVKRANSSKTASPKTFVLPDFFHGMKFLFYGELTFSCRRTLKRLLTAYDGEILEYMDDTVTHVISQSNWDENFDRALSENENLKFIKPDWVFECDKQQKLVDCGRFCVTSG